MKAFLLGAFLSLAIVGCSHDDQEVTGPARLQQIEQQAIGAGVSIRHHNSVSHSDQIEVDYRAVGCTNAELSSAIQILRDYRVTYQATPSANSDYDTNLRTLDDAIADLQRMRTNLLTKNNCSATVPADPEVTPLLQYATENGTMAPQYQIHTTCNVYGDHVEKSSRHGMNPPKTVTLPVVWTAAVPNPLAVNGLIQKASCAQTVTGAHQLGGERDTYVGYLADGMDVTLFERGGLNVRNVSAEAAVLVKFLNTNCDR